MKNFTIKSVKGLTLIELMITIAIAGILISLATPNFRASIQNNRMVTEVNDLHASLNLGRSEAIKRNGNVMICASDDGESCTGAWTDGWIVFADDDESGSVTNSADVLRVHGPISTSNTLSFSETGVTYASEGIATAGSSGTFTLCDSRGTAHAKGLVIGLSGRPRPAVEADLECS